MSTRRHFLVGSAASLLAVTSLPARADWHDQLKVLRVGLAGGENAGDQLTHYTVFQKWLEGKLGIPVKLFQASDYGGIIQAFSAGQIDLCPNIGAAAYAQAWIETNGGVEPLLTIAEEDGSLGYYSLLYVRADSPYKTIDDLKGKSIAFADPNSTSGYFVPSSEFRAMGKDPQTFFGQTQLRRRPRTGDHRRAETAI